MSDDLGSGASFEEAQKTHLRMTFDQRDLIAQYGRMPFLCSDPLAIAANAQSAPMMNGTGFLLALHGRQLLLTNEHVLSKYREVRTTMPAAVLRFGGSAPI